MSHSFTLEELNEIKSRIDSNPRTTDLRPWLWDTALKRERPRREPPNDPKKPPVRRPPGRRKPPVKEPPDDPNPGDPRPDKDRPIGDPPPKKAPQRLSIFPFVLAIGVGSAP